MLERPAEAKKAYERGLLDRHADALPAAKHATELAPDEAGPCLSRGDALLGVGRYKYAVDALRKAAALDSAYVGPWAQRGVAFYAM